MYWKRIFAFVVRKRGQRTLDIVKKRVLRCWRRPVVQIYRKSCICSLSKKSYSLHQTAYFLLNLSVYFCRFFTFIDEKKRIPFLERVDCKVHKTQNKKDSKRILNYIYCYIKHFLLLISRQKEPLRREIFFEVILMEMKIDCRYLAGIGLKIPTQNALYSIF